MIDDILKQTQSIFDDISTTEDVITEFIEKYPNRKDSLDANFLLFKRSQYLTSSLLYAEHCRELAERICNDIDTVPVTDSELFNMMSDTSLEAKFNSDGVLVFDYLYEKVMGEESPAKGLYHSNYPGHIESMVEDIRRKYSVKERKLTKTLA